MGPFIAIVSVIVVLIVVVFLRNNSKTKTNSANSEQPKVNQKELFEALVADGFEQKDAHHCTKFVKAVGEKYEVEIEFSKNQKIQTLDIDVYQKNFSIELPKDISPAFFDFVVFQNYKQMLMDLKGIEILPNQEGEYFLRSSLKGELLDFEGLKEQVATHIDLYENFPYINQADYEKPLFKDLMKEGYQCDFKPQQMLLRFSKSIDANHLSVYYVKGMNMLFLALSPLTDAEIQEDFRDDQTQLHHFNKADLSEEEIKEDIFPSLEEFKKMEAELLSKQVEDLEEKSSDEEE